MWSLRICFTDCHQVADAPRRTGAQLLLTHAGNPSVAAEALAPLRGIRLLVSEGRQACPGQGMIASLGGSGSDGQADDLIQGGEPDTHLASVLLGGEPVAAGPKVR